MKHVLPFALLKVDPDVRHQFFSEGHLEFKFDIGIKLKPEGIEMKNSLDKIKKELFSRAC